MPKWESPCAICGAMCHYELDCWFGSSTQRKKELAGSWFGPGERERRHGETHSRPHLLPRESSPSPEPSRMFGSQWFEGIGIGDIVQRVKQGIFPGSKAAQNRTHENLGQYAFPDHERMRRYIGSPSNSEGEQDAVTFARVARVKTEAGEEHVPVN